jgi:thiol-disulfide isomerase/thioredoxin
MLKKVSLFLLILSVFISSAYAKSDAKASNGKAPGIALEDINGQITMLGQLLSKNNIIISFWSYDCVPCRKEMPELQKMGSSQLFKDKNVKIVYIYVEATTEKTKEESKDKAPKDKALEVLKTLGIKEMCLLDIYGVTYNNYRKACGIDKASMPIQFLISKDKEIVYKAVGYDEKNLVDLEKAIKKLK